MDTVNYRFFAVIPPPIKRGTGIIGSGVKGSAFGYPVNYCCAVGRLKSPISYVHAFVGWVVNGDPFITFIASRRVLVESVYYYM
ncbi:MAG: hypothetical protein U9O90_09045 [Euryarchaeota archaeon]|nr:hypothetical protein [Euryarchaeota archaeon]